MCGMWVIFWNGRLTNYFIFKVKIWYKQRQKQIFKTNLVVRLKLYFRFFPDGKLTMHLGNVQSEAYLDAVRAMERRNLLRINERRLLRIEAIIDGMS